MKLCDFCHPMSFYGYNYFMYSSSTSQTKLTSCRALNDKLTYGDCLNKMLLVCMEDVCKMYVDTRCRCTYILIFWLVGPSPHDVVFTDFKGDYLYLPRLLVMRAMLLTARPDYPLILFIVTH